MMIYKLFLKRLFDFLISLFGLLLISPIFLVVTIVLTITTRGHPFFIQPRPGKNGKIFKIIKFRTMSNKGDRDGSLLPDAERITCFGGFIRKASLDEIPQLFNVLKGDMSLIGPRPLLVEYLPLYTTFQKRRHEVRPGITGWAQVNGRNSISWEEKFLLDVWYVDNLSLLIDLKITWLTMLKVFKSEGVSPIEGVTMEKFNGKINRN